MTDQIENFKQEVAKNLNNLGSDKELANLTKKWFQAASKHDYSYNFKWMGRPIIQYPQDMVALQEIIWETKPDVIVETGIAHGGSVLFNASMLQMLGGDHRKVIAVDIDIREHNKKEIEKSHLNSMLTMIEGSSIDADIIAKIKAEIPEGSRVMVQLDSNHTHEHVLEELRAYAPLTTKGCYCVVLDGIVEDMPEEFVIDRPWGIGNNPKTATHAYLKENSAFEIDQTYNDKLLITVAPDGYLKRTS